MTYSIQQNTESNRFETTVENHRCELNYSQTESVMSMNRVFVPPPVEGRGIAGALTRFALDHCAGHHLKVIPRCPYVAAWIKRHEDYHYLVHQPD